MTPITRENVAKIYVAYFDRAPDKAGLDYWINESGFTDLDKVAQSFADQQETKEKYPDTMTNEEFVNTIYKNMFGRDADAEGLKYWVEELDAEHVTKPHMIEAIALGAKDTNEHKDLTIINNKTKVGLYIADTLKLNLPDFSLSDITADPTTVDAAKEEAQKYVPLRFDLTSDVDTFEGNLGDDTFNAEVLTLTPNDKLIDPSIDDNDILNARITEDKTDEITVKNIENLNFYSIGSNTIDMTNYSGMKTFTATSGSGDITLNNVDENINITVEGVAKGITANFTGTVLQGNSDTFNVTVKNATSASINTSAGFEKTNLRVDGDSSLTTLSAPGVGILTVDGKGDLHVKDGVLDTFAKQIFTHEGKLSIGNVNGIEVLDASAIKDGVVADKMTTDKQGNTLANKTITLASGGSILTGEGDDMLKIASNGANAIITDKGNDTISITKSSTSDILSIDLGEGDDLLQVTNAATTSDDTFNLGDGNDLLRLSNANTQAATINGAEELHIYGDGTASVDLQNADSALQKIVVETANNGNAVTINNIGVGATVNVINYDSDTPQTLGNLTLDWANTEDSQTVNIDVKIEAATHSTTVSKVKDLTLNFNDTVGASGNADTINAEDSQTLTINAKKAAYFGDIKSANSATKTLKVVGNDILTIGNITSTALESVDIKADKDLTVGSIATSALTHLSTVSLNSTNGKVAVTAINSSNSAGLDVNINAKSTIDNGTANTAFTITESGGDINTATLSGDAKANVDFTVDTVSGVVKKVDASTLKGGLTSTITNNDTTPATSSTATVVYLGAKDKNTVNDITFANGVNKATVNGSIGKDTVKFSSSNIKDMTISLGSGDDTLDISSFELMDSSGVAVTEGVIANFSSSSKSVDSKTVSSGKIVAFDGNNDGSYSAKAVNTIKTSGVDSFTATDKSDIIYANATGMTINAGGGADTIIGGAGNDTIIAEATDTLVDGGAGDDSVKYGAAVSSAIADSALVNVENIEITNTNDATYDFSKQTEDLKITGNTGKDTIKGGSGNDVITGGAGADTITGGDGADKFAGLDVADQSIAPTNVTVVDNTNHKFAANDTITFGNGVDEITDFVSGTDKLKGTANNTAPTSLLGVDSTAALTDGTIYVVYGSYDEATHKFTIANSYDATNNNNDALVVEGDGTQTPANEQDYIVLIDINQALVAGDFVNS